MNNLIDKILSIKSELDYNNGVTPLYSQIAQLIKLIIKTGSHKGGEKLPSERLLAETFNVSRVTIRKTFEELLEEGIVFKHQGRGIFICDKYKPNLPKMHIGLLFLKDRVFEFHPMNQMYFAGIKSVLDPLEYTSEIITIDLPFNVSDFKKLIKKKKINGIISFIAEKDTNTLIQKALSNMPLVSRMSEYKTAYIDYKKILNVLFMHLYNKGHRHIALNFAIRGMESTEIIIKEYKELCKKYSLNLYEYEVSNFSMENGYNIIKEIMKNKDITAILAADDYIAQGMFRGLYDMNKSCPKDISVVGIGDYDFANYLVPPLTTVKIPYYDIGVRLAYSIVGKKAKGNPLVDLILRDSVKKVY